jgi:hypothetical protein
MSNQRTSHPSDNGIIPTSSFLSQPDDTTSPPISSSATSMSQSETSTMLSPLSCNKQPLSSSMESPALGDQNLKYRNTLPRPSQFLAKFRKGEPEFTDESVFVSSKKGSFLSTIDPDSEVAQIAKKKVLPVF